MRFRITHQTDYIYESSVSVGHYAAHLAPRDLPSQDCPWQEIVISPKPSERAVRADSFGNSVTYFEVTGLHQKLSVVSRSLVKIRPLEPPHPSTTPPWESVRDAAAGDRFDAMSTAQAFLFGSPLIAPGSEFAAYAAPSFSKARPVLEGVCDLSHRMFTDFVFDPAATDAVTQVDKAFHQRRGVCQDFAQIMIACLRSIGLPARYVSGYLETLPPSGKEKLIGADASHAWVSVWCGAVAGWIDIDPTNDLMPSSRHVTVAWGRDFSDVSPLRGVMQGAGRQKLHVSVDVQQEIEACA